MFTPCIVYAQRNARTSIGGFTPCIVYTHEFTSPLDHKHHEEKTTALFLMPVVTLAHTAFTKAHDGWKDALIFLGVI